MTRAANHMETKPAEPVTEEPSILDMINDYYSRN